MATYKLETGKIANSICSFCFENITMQINHIVDKYMSTMFTKR